MDDAFLTNCIPGDKAKTRVERALTPRSSRGNSKSPKAQEANFSSAVQDMQVEESKNDIFNRADDENFVHMETDCMLSTGSGDYAEFIAKLFGTEIYFYRKSQKQTHEFMHTLVGTFVSKMDTMEKEGMPPMYPVGISLPPKYSRTIYFLKPEDQEKWLTVLQ